MLPPTILHPQNNGFAGKISTVSKSFFRTDAAGKTVAVQNDFFKRREQYIQSILKMAGMGYMVYLSHFVHSRSGRGNTLINSGRGNTLLNH